MPWLKTIAPKAISAGTLMLLADGSTCDVDTFERIFADARVQIDGGKTPYDAFVTVDAGTKGWKATFDGWKSKGII